MVKISKKILLIVFSILVIAGLLVGYYFYKESTRKYNHFFLNAKIYSVNMGIDPNYWSSYYFQPVVENVIQNDDGVVLNVKYKNSDNNWVKTKILIYSEKYDIKNVLFFSSIDERTKAFKPSEHLFDSFDRAKKVIP
ncbi:MAG TPA: hypothetical protein VHA74_00590, partial [Candidatus Dojkabacteria bacterium]|nr:hypothetical protein [Candidatus Dojkabacteria bacterium]